MPTTIRTKKEIMKQLQQLRAEFREFGVKRIGLFGSYVRDTQNAKNDIDILVEFLPGYKTIDNFMHLSFLLEEELNHPVELVTKESLSPYIGSHILKEVEYAPVN